MAKRPKKLAGSRARHNESLWRVRETEFTANFTGILGSNKWSNAYSGLNGTAYYQASISIGLIGFLKQKVRINILVTLRICLLLMDLNFGKSFNI